MSFAKLLTNILAPSVGIVMGNAMFGSSITAVTAQQKLGVPGELNPAPYPLIVVNCVGWTVYAYITTDHFMFFGNAPGVLIGLWLLISSIELMEGPNYASMRKRLLWTLIILAGIMLFLGYIGSTVAAGPGVVGESMAGDLIAFFTVGILCTFYAAPLATLAHVLKTADSSSLHPPLCFMNLINGITWSTYGFFAVNDPFLAYPNGLGATLGCVQCVLCVLLPRTAEKKAGAENGKAPAAVMAAAEMGLTAAESDLDELAVAIGGAPAATSAQSI